jgi:hypothetical protein
MRLSSLAAAFASLVFRILPGGLVGSAVARLLRTRSSEVAQQVTGEVTELVAEQAVKWSVSSREPVNEPVMCLDLPKLVQARSTSRKNKDRDDRSPGSGHKGAGREEGPPNVRPGDPSFARPGG